MRTAKKEEMSKEDQKAFVLEESPEYDLVVLQEACKVVKEDFVLDIPKWRKASLFYQLRSMGQIGLRATS